MSATLADLVNHAQVLAIQKLTRLLQTCDDPAEVRRIASVILRFKLPKPAAAAQARRPAAAPDPTPPPPITPPPASVAAIPPTLPPHLTPDELAALRRLLPHLRPERFSRRDPAYWRSILARHPPPTPRAAAA